jgi:hypothetical protein
MFTIFNTNHSLAFIFLSEVCIYQELCKRKIFVLFDKEKTQNKLLYL